MYRHTNIDRYIRCYTGSDTWVTWIINNDSVINYLGDNPMILKMTKLPFK